MNNDGPFSNLLAGLGGSKDFSLRSLFLLPRDEKSGPNLGRGKSALTGPALMEPYGMDYM